MAYKLVIILIALGFSMPLKAKTYTKAQTEKKSFRAFEKVCPFGI